MAYLDPKGERDKSMPGNRNVSARCGLRPKSFQIRPIVDRDNPDMAAIDARDQCVALRGLDSNVATITSSTWSKPTPKPC
jgi:hypothetical protein